MRLIDGDELMEKIWRARADTRERIADIIESMPTVSPKQGRWIDITRAGGDFIWKCSECGELNLEDTYFCPNCGARMEEVTE